MLNVLIGDIKNGRLLRLQYLGYALFLILLFSLFAFGTILAIGAGEHILGGDLQQAQAQLQEWFSLPFLLIFIVFMAVLSFMSLNIMAKRIRDMGLPGWWMVLILFVLESVVSYFISQQVSSGLHTLIWILLVLIPSDVFDNR